MNHVIHGWSDLRDYGIHVLTGEADGIGLRLLCDLDPKGHELVSEFFGNTLTRNVETAYPSVIRSMHAILPILAKVAPKRGEEGFADWMNVLLVLKHETFEDGMDVLEEPRIGYYVNGPSAFNENDDQRDGLWCSVMLPRSILNSLAVFCLLHHFDVALSSLDATETGWTAMGMSHAEWEEKGDRLHNFHNGNFYYYAKSRHPGNGFRNQHQWTGRVD